MKIALTLVVRDEADIVGEHIRYHLDAGFDLVIATDHRSVDGTAEILRRYERDGVLRLIQKSEEGFAQSTWVTEMARLAAREHEADWVINSDADEFWWPREGSLRDVLAAVPAELGAVRGLWRNFVLRPDARGPLFERMTVRRRPARDAADPYAAHVKVAHRGDAEVVITQGNHDARGLRSRLSREWFPFEIFHFPIRSVEQLERKYSAAVYRAAVKGRVPRHTAAMEERLRSDRDAAYRELLVDDAALRRGLAAGKLSVDTRLRDALRGSEPRRPTLEDDAAFAVEICSFLETDAARVAGERVELLEARLGALEGSRATAVSRLLTHALQVRRGAP
jgi:hypothetical protein